jgi:diacylglycerol kinase (ATP)
MANSTNERWAFIVNPIAGNKSATKVLPELEQKIREYKIDATIAITEKKGHATELAAEFCQQGYQYIIAVGGDGTMNEVGQALIGHPDVVTGIVPSGTGNDFIQILGFPDRFTDQNWESFFNKSTIQLDTGSCNGKYFLNGLGLGFDGVVAAKNYDESGEVKLGGKIKYLWMILDTLLFFREKSAVIESNDQIDETSCFMNTISIGRRHGGSFYLTPEAIANDGLLDVCLIRKLNLFQRLKILTMVPKGTHIHDKKVTTYRTKELSLRFDEEVPFHVDGEVFFSNNYHVKIHPLTLKMIYNPGGPHYLKV